MNKKIIAVLLAAAMCLAMAGCGQTGGDSGTNGGADNTTAAASADTDSGNGSAEAAGSSSSEQLSSEEEQDYELRTITVDNDGSKIWGQAYIPNKGGSRFPLLIFSHGIGNSYRSGRPYAQALVKEGYAVYVFDFRSGGYGKNKSDEIDPAAGHNIGMSLRTEVSDLDAVVDAADDWDFVDDDQISLIGESQGGVVTALEAADEPDDFKSVILLYPAFSIEDDIHERFSSESGVPESFMMFGWVTVGRKYATDIWDMDTYKEIDKYKGPVLLLHGTKDSTVDVSYSDRAAKVYDDVEYHRIEGSEHGFRDQYFDEAEGYIDKFLEKNMPA